MLGEALNERVDLLGRHALVIGLVHRDHRRGSARTETLDGREREPPVGRGFAGSNAEARAQVVDDPLAAAQRARNVAAGLDVSAARILAPKLPVEAEHLLDLDARYAEILDQLGDVLVGDIAAVLLDPAQAR